MSVQLLSGKERSKVLVDHFKEAIAKLNKYEVTPKLVVVTVGEDPASKVYVGQKQKRAQTIGMDFEWLVLPENTTQDKLLEEIQIRNEDPKVSGIIVQLPLPKHLDENQAIEAISPQKDVDGFHPYNLGRLVENNAELVPCTPKGIMDLLNYYNIEVSGKNVVIIGRSQIVGLPLALLMTHANATVSVLHTRTQNPAQYVQQADIIVTAAGNPNSINEDDIQPGTVVVDVSILRGEDGKLHGDVDFEAVIDKVKAITPVPGGVGPMTVAMLMEQTIQCACRQNNIDPQEILGEG
ncbi:bifunctional 5,10-methylenetetrahydrofolate dehydrogenase/5,10-methenyltetrahydrofolate cyclohydrolase [Aerococcaceae bacterium DSM 111176]|nr:bifunctional 5,10-methylenetetrahydrofolate dehydrogenase/5,10-methenyltetrahydrofolate cyclohydrolase [Aerococcaceae bacterium DSM 111176]